MTPFQLLVSAQAPCSSTMVGLGPLLAAARVVAWAEAVWLRGMIRAAMAKASAGIMRRSLARRAVRAMITVISFSGGAQRPFGRIGKALRESPLFRLCGRKLAAGYPERYCTSVNGDRN